MPEPASESESEPIAGFSTVTGSGQATIGAAPWFSGLPLACRALDRRHTA